MALVPRYAVSMKVTAVWSIGLAAFSALTGAVLILDRVLPKTMWKPVHDEKNLAWLVIGLAAVTFVDATRRAVYRLKAREAIEHRVQIRNQLSSVILTIAISTKLNPGDIGCSLFLIQPRGIRRPQQLKRLERVRLLDDLHETHVTFIKGKGGVGKCWQHESEVYDDWKAVNAKYAHDLDGTKAKFDSLHTSETSGFTADEFVSLLGKYDEILAVPVMIGGKFEGCIALDRRWNKGATPKRSLIGDQAVSKVLGAAVQTLAPLLSKR